MSDTETSMETPEKPRFVEESLLSPQTEALPDLVTEPSDGFSEQSIVSSMAELQVVPDDIGLSLSKSMESILLETSRVDESEVVADIPCLYMTESENPLSDGGQDSDETPSNPPQSSDPSEQVLGDNSEAVGAAAESDISEYFKSDVVGHEEDTNFFDNLPPASAAGDPNTDTSPATDERKPLVALHLNIRDESEVKIDSPLSSLSPHIIVEEAKPVSFEEAKGAGFKPTPSTKNLSQFFDDSNENGGGKAASFFDVFTADEGELPLQSPRSSRTFSQSDTSVGSVPPETPPIPSSMAEPPLTSPLQQVFPDSMLSVAMDAQVSNDATTKDIGDIAAFPENADPFLSSLCANDVDRRTNAWIPSEITQQVLVAMVTSTPGSYFPDSNHMSLPKIMIEAPLGDPVLQHVENLFGEEEARKRIVITADNVPQDDTGLRQLISSENWRAAVDLTSRLLAQCGQGPDRVNNPAPHTPSSLQLWFVRIALLMKLRLYVDAESECKAFGNLDSADLYYEFYPDVHGGRRGSMVSFDFRVLHAELPLYLGKSQESLDRLYYLHAIVLKILSNLSSGLAEDGSMLQLSDESRAASRELWESREIRLLYAVGNCALNLKDYAVALNLFEDLLKRDTKNKEALLCGVGRIFLQMGDITRAEEYFQQASVLSDNTDLLSRQRNMMNKGFVALGQNQFAEAHAYFKEVVDLNPTNAVAINNMAVCSLYMGRLTDALATLEKRVMEQPMTFLQESILFNLCTLYELESSHAMQKKETLLGLVNRHRGNGFNMASLKMV